MIIVYEDGLSGVLVCQKFRGGFVIFCNDVKTFGASKCSNPLHSRVFLGPLVSPASGGHGWPLNARPTNPISSWVVQPSLVLGSCESENIMYCIIMYSM